jgi:Leucine-rich repeat (LRR) protein
VRVNLRRISDLSSLTNLRHLNLSRNLLTKLDGLEGLPNLAVLDVSNNQITNVAGLEHVKNLLHLVRSPSRFCDVISIADSDAVFFLLAVFTYFMSPRI